ncbi:MAG: EAL domain-containing protein [Gammaproteobacteria bacterium]|nr:EAL domain-containing protein [Gammaproteobacteria bacterium]
MYQSTLNGQLVSVEPRMATLLGYASADELRDSISDIASQLYAEPSSRQRLLALLHEQGAVNHLESRVRRKDGSMLWIAEYAHAIRNESGDVTGLRGALVDITPLRRQLGSTADSYRSFFVNSVIGMYRSTQDGELIEANPALARLLGYENAAELLADVARLDQLYPSSAEREAVLDSIATAPRGANIEFFLLRRDGEMIRVQENSRAVRDREGNVLFFEGTVQDVTQRFDAERDLRRSEERYRALVDNSQVGVFVARKGRYEYVNEAFACMLGMRRGDLQGQHFRGIYAPEAVGEAEQRFAARQRGEQAPTRFETTLLHADGITRVPVIVTIQALHQDGEILSTGTVSDVGEQKRIERELRHNATHDALTGLPNRQLFLQRLEKKIADGRINARHEYAVCFLDLDGFKVINDSLGHAAGDDLLKQIATRISNQVEAWDMVSRHGGDEFTLLLDNITSPDRAMQVALRLRESLNQPFTIRGNEVYTRASIGIAMGDEGVVHAEELLRDADTAMYAAKHSSHNGVALFDLRMHETARWRLRLETDLRVGLERGEFELHFQPIRRLSNGQPAGFEALLRWKHPDFGLLLPGDFLAVAEETGLILPIGWWVLEQAALQIAAWEGALPDREFFISANIAHRQFHHPGFEARLASILRDTGVPASRLHLELTESIFMDNPSAAVTRLEKLKAMGCRLYLDDFGTGYSSFSYLNQYPLDAVKIDRSFIAEMSASTRGRKVVGGIVQLANAIGVDIVAEGIETDAQWRQLRRFGIRLGQGRRLGSALDSRAATESLLMPTPLKRNWLDWLKLRQAPRR